MAADNFARVLAMKANSDLIDVNQLIDQLEELIGDIESYDLDTLFGRVNQNTADIETINGDSTVENSTYWKIANTDFVVGITKNTTTGKWEFANNDGTTTYIDFSQVATIPPNNANNVNRVVQYTGATTQNYITGYFYRCVAETSGGITTYVWKQLDVQDSTKHWVGTRAELTAALANGDIEDGTIILITDEPDVDNFPTENSTNLVYSGGVYTALQEKQDIIQVSEMAVASNDELGKIYQYIGVTNNNFTNGYFYKCVYDSGNDSYSWNAIKVQSQDSHIVAEEFDDTTAYSIGDYCLYNNDLYICTTAHAAGVWDANDFTATNVTTELKKKTEYKEFVGTSTEWSALTLSEKIEYSIANFTDQ